MRRNTNFARGSHVPAATLNAVQDEQQGLIVATGAAGSTPALTGADGRYWTSPDAGVADGDLVVIDATAGIDWRARRVWGVFRKLTAANQRPQGASAWQANDPSQGIATRRFEGLTGTGGFGAAAATVALGTPPVVAAGSFAVLIDEGATTADRVWLYVSPTTHALCLYNDSGATLHGELLVWGAGASPTAGAEPPSVIPTLTEVQWLEPAAAADRPADPGGPALFRAIDTGAVSLFDGGSWRALGGGGSVTIADITDAGAVGAAVLAAETQSEARVELDVYSTSEVDTAIAGTVLKSTLTTRGDLFVRGASAIGRLALGAAKRILSSDGTDAVYQTIASLMEDLGSTRGSFLRRGASAWEAVTGAGASNTFLGGDGSDLAVRTASQARVSLGIDARSGTYAAIGTASSYPGGIYYVESGTNAGNLYQSVATGSGAYAWKLVDFTPYAPLDSTCRLSFEFADASGAATIANGGAAGGTLTKAGSPTIADYPILGLRGLTCPTPSDYYAGLDAEVVGAAYTAEAWISGGSGSGLQTVFCRRADVGAFASPYSAFALDLSGAQLRTFTGTTTGWFAAVAGSVPTTAVTHIAQTWSAATNLLLGYVNGALVSSAATTGTMVANGSGRWGVGQIPGGGGAVTDQPFGGTIYMARAYNAVLTPTQIQERWARGVRMYRA